MHRNGTLFKNNGILLIRGHRSASVGSATSIHNPTCLNGITISTPLYQSVEVPFQHGIYVIFWFLSGFMVDTLLVSPECSVFSWTPLTSHRWPTPTTANVWWFPAVNYHLFLECPFKIVMFCGHFVLVTHDATNGPMKLPAILNDMAEGHPSKNGWSCYHQTSNA